MKKLFIFPLITILFVSCNLKEQNANVVKANIEDCDCLSNYHWLKKTFEENDAGYRWVIEEKGLEVYQQFCDSIEQEIKYAKDMYECQAIFRDWGKFFRKGHFGISLNVASVSSDTISEPETVNYTVQSISEQSEKTNDIMVGVWSSPPYKIGIVQDTIKSGRKYVGFIIESEVPEWKEGQVKIEFFQRNNQLFAHFYMRDFSVERRSVALESDVELYVGNMLFTNNLKGDPLEQKLLGTSNPFFYKLSERTTLLRIPSFNSDQTKLINGLIEENRPAILSHENLIIDLRGNGGGADRSWNELIPFIYTTPIKTIGAEFLSTSLNREYLKNNTSFIGKLLIRKFFKNLDSNDGGFVSRDSMSIRDLDDILPNPQNVIVLVDELCASSVEQFLLAAQQSKKVEIYGKQTFGALDVSNVANAVSPDKCFVLAYCTSRTLRPKSNRIDDIGIMPDFEINDSIPKYQWISFVLDRIE